MHHPGLAIAFVGWLLCFILIIFGMIYDYAERGESPVLSIMALGMCTIPIILALFV